MGIRCLPNTLTKFLKFEVMLFFFLGKISLFFDKRNWENFGIYIFFLV
jgi:hypothetical protein